MIDAPKEAAGFVSGVAACRSGASPARRGLRIVLYDPSERGGVAQYTYHLAEHLAKLNNDVTVATGEKYELKHLPRSFNLRFLSKRSWVKALLFPERGSRVAGKATAAGESDGRLAQGGTSTSWQAALKDLRRLLLDVRLIIWLLWSRVDVVHFQWSVNRAADCRLMRLLKAVGIKSFYTAHDLAPHAGLSAAARDALARLYAAMPLQPLQNMWMVAKHNIRAIPREKFIACARF